MMKMDNAMKKELLFLTAAVRLHNLKQVGQSIIDAKRLNSDWNFNWLICVDDENGKYITGTEHYIGQKAVKAVEFDIEEVSHIVKTDIVVVKGLSIGQKHYGGDLFNQALKKVYSDHDDCFVYILDDDNIVHPMLVPTLNKINNKIDCTDKIIWLTKISSTGFVAEAVRNNAYAKVACNTEPGYWQTYECMTCDPSQAVQTLFGIFSWKPNFENLYPGAGNDGMFPNEFDYDSKLYFGQWIQNPDQFIFFQEWIDEDSYQNDPHPATYHNGLRTRKQLAQALASWKSSEKREAHIVVQTDTDKTISIPLNKQNFKTILELITDIL